MDYIKIFAAVVKPMSYKSLFVVRVKCSYRIYYINVVISFLYNFLNEVIYVKQPHFFILKLSIVCKLIKALYKLKQIPHVWYKTLVKFFKKLGFIQLKLNHEIFVSTDK